MCRNNIGLVAGAIALAFVALLFPANSLVNAAPEKTQGFSAADKSFVMEAARGGVAEVRLGQLATERAENPDVKAFGQRMVTDHTAADNELTQLASSKGVTVPSEMDAKDRTEYDRLSKLSGHAFDRAYMQAMVQDHRQDVATFERESTRAADPALRQWAAKTLPTLKSHLQQAESTWNKVKA